VTRRILTALTGILILAGAAASVALADPPGGSPPLQARSYDGRSPDTKDAAYTAHHTRTTYNLATGYATPPDGTLFDGRSPDTKDAAYAAHHSSWRRIVVATISVATQKGGLGSEACYRLDGKPTRLSFTQIQELRGHGVPLRHALAPSLCGLGSGSVPDGTSFDGRSQDTKDAAALAHTSNVQTPVTGPSGFAWDDAGIGAAAALVVIAVLGFGTTRLRNRRLNSLPS